MTLSQLARTQRAVIRKLPENFDLTTKLIEQGFALKTEVTLAHKAPFNGPIAFNLHGTKICIAPSVAQQIGIEIV
ncbi:FeoA family protein [Thalassotalea castellviae]|uniref:FeoA family protein n=1 Tax=Thalassotalea castellviae TaxID=3075612 RepID=A0ABU3A181_9GAMM|nr:FeoA family protein [Thalassotalea sp. W431]MDT0603719.1 FeoA family protein [Thalassotalea sp. W431]